MKSNYDNVSGIYDLLSRVIFGRKLINAQLYLLPAIPPGSHVLIVGGGTGWILAALSALKLSGLTIDYVEASAAMIKQAEKKATGNNQVSFINQYLEDTVHSGKKYDVVITPFLFDNFSEATMRKVFSIVNNRLDQKGLWLYCDFRKTDNAKHKLLLKGMYTFFRAICSVEASELPDTEDCFLQHYYHPVAYTTFMKGFIVSSVYKRV